MDYNKLLEKTGADLYNKGYSCYIGEGIIVSIGTNDYNNDYTLVIENNEGMSTLDYGEKDFIFVSYYIAVCMAERKAKFPFIEKTFDPDNNRETFTRRVEKWLKPRELSAIKGHEVFLARKTYYEGHKEEYSEKRKVYYQEHREELLEQGRRYYKKNKKKMNEYGREYRKKQKLAA